MQIKFESVNHIYNANTPMEQRALYDINFDKKLIVIDKNKKIYLGVDTTTSKWILLSNLELQLINIVRKNK